ncbi:MAG: hypothetical protein ABEJ88_07795 [Halobacterium sp.]
MDSDIGYLPTYLLEEDADREESSDGGTPDGHRDPVTVAALGYSER